MQLKIRLLLVGAAFAFAQSCLGGNNLDHYAAQKKGATEVKATGDDAFGEVVSLATGATSFSVTDVSVPTNSGLQVAVGRKLDVNSPTLHLGSRYDLSVVDAFAGVTNGIETQKDVFGRYWELDIPYIQGVFDHRLGWTVDPNPLGSWGAGLQERCTKIGPPPIAVGNWPYYQAYFKAYTYWSGNTINIPGKGEEALLYLPSGPVTGADNVTYHATTKSNWRVGCKTSIQNGTGEGFVVLLPDGVKYTFDWMAAHRRPSLVVGPTSPAVCSPNVGCPENSTEDVLVPRDEIYLYVSRVDDRFGNWVKYTYDTANPTHLLSVTSNDGASISLHYNANGHIDWITSGSRTWNYTYAADTWSLASVTLPDQSKWTYQFDNLQTLFYQDEASVKLWYNCVVNVGDMTTSKPVGVGDGATMTITAPSGLTGLFKFRKLVHGTANTPGGCTINPINNWGKLAFNMPAAAFEQASLYSKTLTGPGIGSLTWTYDYYPTWSWSSQCTQSCVRTSQTVVTDPIQVQRRYTFGADYSVDGGRLLSTEVQKANVTKQKASTTYLASASGQLFPDANGTLPNILANPLATKNRPVVGTVIDQDGVLFSSTILSYDKFAFPSSVRRSSSLGFTRTDSILYEHNLVKWVLGQVKSTTNTDTGIVVSQTDYSATTALPTTTYAFGLKQRSFSYNADGTVATSTDNNGHVTKFSSYKRGAAQSVIFPDPAVKLQAVISDDGWLTSLTDPMSYSTGYKYDPVGRLRQTDYPTNDSVTWNASTTSFAPEAADIFGTGANHWKKTEATGLGRVTTYYDARWLPTLTITEDTSSAATKTFTVRRYDGAGREVFRSYPVGTLTTVNDDLKGVTTQYDELNRVSRIDQDSELGPLTTTTEYLSGFQTRTTNPGLSKTTTTYQVFDQPDTSAPMKIIKAVGRPEQQATTITRDVFGKPLTITRSGS